MYIALCALHYNLPTAIAKSRRLSNAMEASRIAYSFIPRLFLWSLPVFVRIACIICHISAHLRHEGFRSVPTTNTVEIKNLLNRFLF